MIKAGALTYAVFLMVVAAILCTMMIVIAAMNRDYFVQINAKELVKDNAYSGIALAMSDIHQTDFDLWKDIYGNGLDSVFIRKRRWGAYWAVSARAIRQADSYQKVGMIGYEVDKFRDMALWLTDLNRPLQLGGEALLKGTCYVPKKGLDRAYIEGVNYKREKLIYGEKRGSESILPTPDSELKKYWSNYFEKKFVEQDSIVSFDQLPNQLSHSFSYKTLVAVSDQPVNLTESQFQGNIIIISGSRITVPKSAKLDNVVLIAPEVELEEGTKGTMQILASDSVLLRADVELNYPSSIIMLSRHQTLSYCLITSEAIMKGCILCFDNKDPKRSNKLALEIQPKGLVIGLVYCEDNFELGGEIRGSVVCNKFLLATPSGIYENHLLNGQIDRNKLPDEFASVRFENLNTRAKAIAWLQY